MDSRPIRPNFSDIPYCVTIALAISVAIRCDGCVAFHSKAAVKHGATRDEVMETMGMALYMGAGPSLMYAAQAVEAFDQFSDQAKQ